MSHIDRRISGGAGGDSRGPATAVDAADVDGAGGPPAAVDVHRHQHARQRQRRHAALGGRPGEFGRGGRDDRL